MKLLSKEIPKALRAGSPYAASTKGVPKYIDLLESISAKSEEMQPRKGIPTIID